MEVCRSGLSVEDADGRGEDGVQTPEKEGGSAWFLEGDLNRLSFGVDAPVGAAGCFGEGRFTRDP